MNFKYFILIVALRYCASDSHITIQEAIVNAACIISCENNINNQTGCIKGCASTAVGSLEVDEYSCEYEDALLELVCRSESQLTVSFPEQNYNETVKYIAAISDLYSNQTGIKELSSDDVIIFGGLQSNQEYTIKLYTVNKGGVIDDVVCQNFTTLSNKFLATLTKAASINITNIYRREYDINIFWEPSVDKTCQYDIITLLGPDEMDNKSIIDPKNLYSAEYTQLKYGKNYSIGIMSKSEHREGEIAWTSLRYICPDLDYCVPEKPEHLNVTDTLISAPSTFDIHITWAEPELHPDYYEIALERGPELELVIKNISGLDNEYKFSAVELNHFFYVQVKAVSRGGFVSSNVHMVLPPTAITHAVSWSPGVTISLSIGCALVFLAITYGLYRLHMQTKRNKQRLLYFTELGKKSTIYIETEQDFISTKDDPMEISLDKLLISNDILGQGAFGIVRKGFIKAEDSGNNIPVAIKMLKDLPLSEDVRMFKQEIVLLRSIGQHPNIVSLLGFCSKVGQQMFLISEYCAKGDLLEYLRTAWKIIISQQAHSFLLYNNNDEKNINEMYLNFKEAIPSKYTNITDISDPTRYRNVGVNKNTNVAEGHHHLQNVAINKLYEMDALETKELTPADLLSFARQVAIGMEFLSSNRVIHRDLAARNVLVCSNNVVKIADFGLSRDIYAENHYRKTGNGKLPIRWLSLESFTHQLYTTQSDVWSFGVLLWEIVTLGANPYPSIPTTRLLKLLLGGYRMEHPPNCSQDLYNVMLSCWQTKPRDRPTFAALTASLDRLLMNETSQPYLTLNMFAGIPEDQIQPSAKQNSGTYLNPIKVATDLIRDQSFNSSGSINEDQINETEIPMMEITRNSYHEEPE